MKMKKLLILFALIVIPTIMRAQKPLELDMLVNTPGYSKEHIYNMSRTWFIADSKKIEKNIESEDKETGVIKGKAIIPMSVNSQEWASLSGALYATIKIQANDGSFRLQFYNIIHESYKGVAFPEWSQGYVYDKVPEFVKRKDRKRYEAMITYAYLAISKPAAEAISTIQSLIETILPEDY